MSLNKPMDKNNKRLIVVGDRVLIHVNEGEERTKVGLYLPPTALDSQAVQGGKIVATGPGLPMPDPGEAATSRGALRCAKLASFPCRPAPATTRCSSAKPP